MALVPSGRAIGMLAGSLPGHQLEAQLRQLVRVHGTKQEDAAAMARGGPSLQVCETLVRCLEFGLEGGAPFCEIDVLTMIVRLLGGDHGDMTGDSLTPSPEKSDNVDVARLLRTEPVVLAVCGLLQRRASAFEAGEDPFLRLEALRALRLLITPEGLTVGGTPAVSMWHTREDLAYLANGETPRRVAATLVQALRSVGDSISQRPKVAAIGALWGLAAVSTHCRTRIQQAGGTAAAAAAFHAQAKQKGPVVEAAVVVECGLLVELAAGSRKQERQLSELRVDEAALLLLHAHTPHRQVVCAAIVLLGVVARDDAAAARLAAAPAQVQGMGGRPKSAPCLASAVSARDRWPGEVENAVRGVSHGPLAPVIQAMAVPNRAPESKLRVAAATPRMLLDDPPRGRCAVAVGRRTPRGPSSCTALCDRPMRSSRLALAASNSLSERVC